MNGIPILKDKDKNIKTLSLTKWRKKCDTRLQEQGKIAFPKCEVCNKQMSCLHHFFPKSVSARLRYDWDNLVPICSGCHMRHHQAGDPTIHATVLRKRGNAWYDTLLKKKNESIKVNISYYRYVYEMLL